VPSLQPQFPHVPGDPGGSPFRSPGREGAGEVLVSVPGGPGVGAGLGGRGCEIGVLGGRFCGWGLLGPGSSLGSHSALGVSVTLTFEGPQKPGLSLASGGLGGCHGLVWVRGHSRPPWAPVGTPPPDVHVPLCRCHTPECLLAIGCRAPWGQKARSPWEG
jgi:hypothetical protein